jgi:hypothetical protein
MIAQRGLQFKFKTKMFAKHLRKQPVRVPTYLYTMQVQILIKMNKNGDTLSTVFGKNVSKC